MNSTRLSQDEKLSTAARKLREGLAERIKYLEKRCGMEHPKLSLDEDMRRTMILRGQLKEARAWAKILEMGANAPVDIEDGNNLPSN